MKPEPTRAADFATLTPRVRTGKRDPNRNGIVRRCAGCGADRLPHEACEFCGYEPIARKYSADDGGDY